MYERSYGKKYDVPAEVTGQRYVRTVDIAKLIRADIKAAIQAGDLPGTAKNYSVRSHTAGTANSIDVESRGLTGMWEVCPGYIQDKYGPDSGMYGCGNSWCINGGEHKDLPQAEYHPIMSAEGRRVKEVLQAIHDAYNHDGSEIQVDYFDRRYWGHAEVSSDERELVWRQCQAKRAA